MKIFICSLAGSISAVLAGIFGAWTGSMTTLGVCMALDFVTGLILAGVFKMSKKTDSGAASSRECLKGIFRKFGVLCVVVLAGMIDKELGTVIFKTGVCWAFIVSEGLSLLENVGLMGVPIPSIITKGLDLLQEKAQHLGGKE